LIIVYVFIISIFQTTETATAEMSRIIQQILTLLTLFSQVSGRNAIHISFGLLAETTWDQWEFSLSSSNTYTARGELEDVMLTRKQLRELKHRLQRRIRRFQNRLAKHQSVINAAVLLYGEDTSIFHIPSPPSKLRIHWRTQSTNT
jgi:hypothetical protein